LSATAAPPRTRTRACPGFLVAEPEGKKRGELGGQTPYPPYIESAEERRRWDLCEGIGEALFGDLDPASVWLATRAIYRSDVPTGVSARSDLDPAA
jgi:hypothetical protein